MKKLCVLQVTPEEPNADHVSFFENKENCDFYFVTHDADNKKALKYCPNTTWVDTRNILAELVPKQYEYYAFVDYDFIFEPKGHLGVLEQIIFDLEKWNPAVLTYYPGKGFITPFVNDTEYFNKHEYSIIPFTHCGMKVIHHTLMDWFFPMITKFGGGVDACHMFNILEIPFLKNVICSHKMTYRNDVNDPETPHNRSGAISKMNMDKMWHWILPAYKKSDILISKYGNKHVDSLCIKEFFVSLFKHSEIQPKREKNDINYFSQERFEKFFDLNHEWFNNINFK
jgi:hypothetical protein